MTSSSEFLRQLYGQKIWTFVLYILEKFNEGISRLFKVMLNLALRKPSGRLFSSCHPIWTVRISLRVSSSISGIFPFVRKQYEVLSIHFKASLPVTFTSIAC